MALRIYRDIATTSIDDDATVTVEMALRASSQIYDSGLFHMYGVQGDVVSRKKPDPSEDIKADFAKAAQRSNNAGQRAKANRH